MEEYQFHAEEVRDQLIRMIREFTEKMGIKKVVIGISGGKDSSTAAALCARALGAENVYGIMMPDKVQADIADSERICEALGIRGRTVNIGKIHEALKAAVSEELYGDFFPYGDAGADSRTPIAEGEMEHSADRLGKNDGGNREKSREEKDRAARCKEAEHESNINVCPRIRMTVLRYIAQTLGAFVCGTGNLSESTVGYCTKDGDTSCDFNVLGKLTSLEVVEVGLSMEELPPELIRKAPSDGLSGMTDEEKMGITYRQIHDYIRKGSSGDEKTDEIIRRKWKASGHKRRLPSVLDPFTGDLGL